MRSRCLDCLYYCHELGFCYTSRGNHPISCAYYIKERSDDSLSISSTELENGVIASAYGLSYEEVIRGRNRLMEEYFQQITCIACGAPLDAVTRGRHKFCAKCGVYLPRIIYDKSA